MTAPLMGTLVTEHPVRFDRSRGHLAARRFIRQCPSRTTVTGVRLIQMQRRDLIRLIRTPWLRLPLSNVMIGPHFWSCPACEVDDRANKQIKTLGAFMNHVIRHMRRVFDGDGRVAV